MELHEALTDLPETGILQRAVACLYYQAESHADLADRFVADIRAALYKKMKKEGKKTGHVCHPYDVCAILIGQEAGVIITDIYGNPLNYPLDTMSPVNWVAYANEKIQQQVGPALKAALEEHKII